MGLDDFVNVLLVVFDFELIDLVIVELGVDWLWLVVLVFDFKKVVVFDDCWVSVCEDLVKLWLIDEGDIDVDWLCLVECFEGVGYVVVI